MKEKRKRGDLFVLEVLVCVCVRSVAQLGLILLPPYDFGQQVSPSMGFSPKNTGVGCRFSLQGVFLDTGIEPVSPWVMLADSLPLSCLESPRVLLSLTRE